MLLAKRMAGFPSSLIFSDVIETPRALFARSRALFARYRPPGVLTSAVQSLDIPCKIGLSGGSTWCSSSAQQVWWEARSAFAYCGGANK
jgi:hypothetical protein